MSTRPPVRRFGPSVRVRIVAVVLVAVIPGFVLAFIAAERERREAKARAETQTAIVVTTAADRYAQLLRQADTLLQSFAELGVDQLPEGGCQPILALLVRELAVYDDIVITTPEGDIKCSATGTATTDEIANSDWLTEAKTTGEFTVGAVESSPTSTEPKQWVAREVPGAGGESRSVLAARFSWPLVGAELVPDGVPHDATVTVFDGDTLAYEQPPASGSGLVGLGDAEVVRAIESSGDSGTVVAEGLDGEKRVYTFQKTPGGVTVLAGIPTDAAYAQAARDFRTNLLWLTLAAIVAIAAAVKFGDLVIGLRLRSLVGVTRRIAAGDLTARSGRGGGDEIGELETSLDAMADELERREAERLQLLGNVVDAAESERKRIAGDVHDDSIQVMTAHVMGLQLIRRRVDDPAVAERLRELEDSGRAAIARLRDLVFDLHSPVLDELGLGPAIEVFCERTFEGESVDWTVVDELGQTAPIAARDTAYRVAQEALQNARRHAQPSTVRVELRHEGDELVLRIADDGRGFEPDDVGARPGHRGLLGARERAEAAGGRVEITSSPGAGTIVTCRIPWRLGVEDEPAPVPVA